MDWYGVRKDVGSVPVHRDEKGPEPKSKALHLPADLRSYPHLRSRALGSD